MRIQIENAALDLQEAWKDLNMESIEKIKTTIQSLANDRKLISKLQNETGDLLNGIELYRDKANGFVLLTYAENQGTYRTPHNHGDAWVVYTVVTGEVEMGNYFEASSPNKPNHLVLKSREVLTARDTRIYLPGEIHDTRCISKSAIVLRLTSSDLKEEERAGRMKRYQI